MKLPNELTGDTSEEVEQRGLQTICYYLFYQTKQPTWQSRQNTCIHMDKSQIEQMQTNT